MRKGLLISLLVVLFMVVAIKCAIAGSYTISTTAEQDAILQKASTFYGATVEQIITNYKDDAIKSLVPKIEREKKRLLMQKYDTLTETEKSQIEGIINQ